jgi:bifunctional non-homologous end joining protein LigD
MVRKLLARYRAKRDFSKTAEPSGGTKVKASKGLRFVVQKHAASHLHYDLRLELDGVFKSWAVTKGPSLDPHDKRLAVEVEDHPLDYGDFEGTIRGHWNCENAERAYRKGKLDFTLEGKKLHGGWILTRMRKREGENRINWLLIKHRDEFAREGKKNRILDEDTSVASGRSVDEITAGKGWGPKPFVTAKKTRAPEWKSHGATARASSAKKRSRPVAVRSSRSSKEKGFQKRADSFRSKDAPFYRPSVMYVGRPAAGRGRMGPRDQI